MNQKPFYSGLLYVLLLAAPFLLMGCRPADTAEAGASQSPSHTLYLSDAMIAEEFLPLDSATLAGRDGEEPIGPMLISADGATGVTTEHTSGRANPDPATAWVVVRDLPNGNESARFHPPVSGLVTGLSADGSRLLWQPFPLPVGVYPPPVDWYVLNTAGGVAGRVRDEESACFRQSALLAPDGERLYCLVDPALHEISGPQPVRVAAYEVGGGPAAEVALETRIGHRPTADGAGWELLEPALTLSPDGATLAVVHADADRLTLLHSHDLSIAQSLDLAPPRSLLDIFGLSAAPAHAKGEMSGTLRQAVFSADGRRLYIFSQVLIPPGEPQPEARGLWVVDLEQGRVAAEALTGHQIQWVLPAPDGSVYVYGTMDENLMPYEIRKTSPSMLWRLDGRTLAVLAAREFGGYRGGRLIGE